MLGKHHPLLRRIRALRNDAALRRSEGLFVAEGLHLVAEALATDAAVETFLISPRISATDEGRLLLARIRERRLPVEETADSLLESIQDARSAQPVLGLMRRTAPALETIGSEVGWVLMLDSIQDPGNLGSILRSADGASCGLCLVTGRSADPYHPRAVRATMGSVFRLPLVELEAGDALRYLNEWGLEPVGADPHDGARYDEADLSGRLALVLGGESCGPSAKVRSRLTRRIRIPMREGVESLSVAAAGAVLLFEVARQRRR